MKLLIVIMIGLVNWSCCAQGVEPKFNLNFEQNSLNEKLPAGWFQWGTYDLQKDSADVHSGKYSASIISSESGDAFGSITYQIPAHYEGEEIVLKGYMKTDKVADGFAGLLMRIDGNGSPLVFDNMQDQNVHGTLDWKQYKITLKYPKEAQHIFVAGILTGSGQAWFDDFTVTIDGENIQTLAETDKPIAKAQLDKEFDEGSKFSLTQADTQQVKRLTKLAKIWGFLKYYHPQVASGDIHWDYELFRMLPSIQNSHFDEALAEWLTSMDNTDAATRDPNFSDAKLHPDIDWVSDTSWLNSAALGQELIKVKNSERKAANYYISLAPGVGNPVFQEAPYPNMAWNDTGYRLLALFRYWNMIEYFFPYKHLIGRDWNEVLTEYIPKIIVADDELSYKLTLLRLIGEIHDTHANIWQQDEAFSHFYGTRILPIAVDFVENKPVVVKLFDRLNGNHNIEVGDVITKINGEDVAQVIAEKIQYCPASNEPTQLRDVARRLLRTNEDSITITFEKQNGSVTNTVRTADVDNVNFWQTDVNSHIIENDIGYVYPGTLEEGEIDEIMQTFSDKKGIIIDLRCYPSDFIVFSMGKYLMPEPKAFVKFTSGSLDNPGLFSFTEPLTVGEHNGDYYKGKIIILINEKTQSQAEYTTMALRVAPQATVIGSTTAGADGNVSTILLPGNIRTMISGIGVYYPDGTETQRVGIVPDIEVKPTIAGIREGRDEVLEKAIRLIQADDAGQTPE